jgi:hypothetical protein
MQESIIGCLMAEGVRFELTVGYPTTIFKTVALNHSATPPVKSVYIEE